MQLLFLNTRKYSHQSDILDFPVSISITTNQEERYFIEIIVNESDLKNASEYINRGDQIEIKQSGRCFCVVSSNITDVKICLLNLLECNLIDRNLYKTIITHFPIHEKKTGIIANFYESGLAERISDILSSMKHCQQFNKYAFYNKDERITVNDTVDLKTTKNSVKPLHDTNFNPRHKTLYESKLAAITMKYGLPYFMPIIKKVNMLIYNDLHKCLTASDNLSSALNKKIINSMKGKLFELDSNPQILLNFCRSTLPEHFELQMDLQYEWITFFTAKETPTDFFQKAIQENWKMEVNLERFLEDTIKYRSDLYKGRTRAVKNSHGENPVRFKLYQGICDTETEADLNLKDKKLLARKHPIINPGINKERITGGSFFKKACFTYDTPAICGPSGTMAKRLSLANQAGLNYEEKALYAFVVGMYQLSIASHSIDEIFSIAKIAGFSTYNRGDYTSLFPDSMKQFTAFYSKIHSLNEEYSDFSYPKDIKTTGSLTSKMSPNSGLL